VKGQCYNVAQQHFSPLAFSPRTLQEARVITDFATFAYLADVFIIQSHRGQGISKNLVATIQAHPQLQGLRRWMLITRDAHGLYAPFGFTGLGNPDRVMEITKPYIYVKLAAQSCNPDA
jgi:GNAT superfamily N-acetyltransferase